MDRRAIWGTAKDRWWAVGLMFFIIIAIPFVASKSPQPTAAYNSVTTEPTTIPTLIPQVPDQSLLADNTASSSKVLGWHSTIPINSHLQYSSDMQLRTLGQYEQIIGSGVSGSLMVFTDMPATNQDATSVASSMAAKLKEFHQNSISPLVIMEPTINGSPVNFSDYRNGAYDQLLQSYFQALRNDGVTDSMMGVWVYFPEANLPQWGPVDQADFAPNVVRTVKIQKKYFPKSQSSILLDAESYPNGTTSWGDGSYVSLSPFIGGIPKGLLDSFGLQGFPWVPPATQPGWASVIDPAVFLNSSTAIEAASQLGVADIWFNTGTFSAKYTNDSNQTVTMNAAQRQTILNGIIGQALDVKNAGFSAAVNLFSEDKSSTSIATDWSYKSADDQSILKAFASQLAAEGIGFWIFSG